jgi:hypothetical protein
MIVERHVGGGVQFGEATAQCLVWCAMMDATGKTGEQAFGLAD